MACRDVRWLASLKLAPLVGVDEDDGDEEQKKMLARALKDKPIPLRLGLVSFLVISSVTLFCDSNLQPRWCANKSTRKLSQLIVSC